MRIFYAFLLTAIDYATEETYFIEKKRFQYSIKMSEYYCTLIFPNILKQNSHSAHIFITYSAQITITTPKENN